MRRECVLTFTLERFSYVIRCTITPYGFVFTDCWNGSNQSGNAIVVSDPGKGHINRASVCSVI